MEIRNTKVRKKVLFRGQEKYGSKNEKVGRNSLVEGGSGKSGFVRRLVRAQTAFFVLAGEKRGGRRGARAYAHRERDGGYAPAVRKIARGNSL